MSEYKIEYDGLHSMMITYKLCGILPSKIMVNPSDGGGFAEYTIKRKCKPIAKSNNWGLLNYYCTCGHKLLEIDWDFVNYYCTCGDKPLEIANKPNEHMPKYCEKCGAEIIYK